MMEIEARREKKAIMVKKPKGASKRKKEMDEQNLEEVLEVEKERSLRKRWARMMKLPWRD